MSDVSPGGAVSPSHSEAAGLHETQFDVRVVGRTRGADGVELFELGPLGPLGDDRAALPGWTAGSHIDVVLPDGEVRQYSLWGAPSPGSAATWRIGVLLEPSGRGGSAWLHSSLHVGDTLTVAGPRNHFEFVPTHGTRYELVAGGIGITPISSMAAAAKAAGVPYRLHYAGRSRETMALLDDLAQEHGDALVIHAAADGDRLDLPALFADMPPFTTTYCCGPARLLDAIEAAGRGRQVVVERFTPREVGAPVLNEPFEVELAATGVTVTVPPSRSILDVAEEAGALVLSSCREGTCGTCETVVLSGEVDHRDSILTPDEQDANDVMYVCVSRSACPRLVLDL
ncbi:PDR/VanB family oxidoreductase [Frondihabitans australicus]|uniref:Ferredoxin-NADP reductase n=1 Tax=Frondihabitans australicus TaxID=386892 RepID=A0A495IJW1_9MICO|nr:PDR/VanB family oxidoreductase [Frondihabitans australicus]RKR76010.1 ferredoxin-NADP reductase [Frondihabitans australicus]